jgi:hypothetical protein
VQSNTSRFVYECLEVLVPGAFFTGCLMAIYQHPAVASVNEWTIGAVVIFALISYAVGHLVQTLSNTIEKYWWRAVGGMPLDWVRSGKKQLLPDNKVTELERHVRVKLHLGPDFKIAEQDGGGWYFLVRQIHGMVVDGRPSQRASYLDTCMAINRGLACAVFALAILYLLNDPFVDPSKIDIEDFSRFYIGAVVFMVGMLTLFRMQRFGVQYALELFAQFILLPAPMPVQRARTGELSLEAARAIDPARANEPAQTAVRSTEVGQ